MASDLDLEWNGDLVVSPNGDLKLVSGADKVRQHILRRFLTNGQILDTQGRVVSVPEYIWHPDYGGNARAAVDSLGGTASINNIQQRLTRQALLEADIVVEPPPQIRVTAIVGGVRVDAAVAVSDGTIVSIQNTRIKS